MQHQIFIKVWLIILISHLMNTISEAQESPKTNTNQREQTYPSKIFTIDESSGEVKCCDLIKHVNTLKYSERNIAQNELSKTEKQNLFKKINKKGDNLFTVSTKDKKHHVCIDASHGGYVNALYFFDSKFNFKNKFTFEKLQILDVEFNSSENYLCVSGPFNGNFYFFSTEGKLITSGNFNQITGDRGTSYGKIGISTSGEFYMLCNNSCYIFTQKGVLIDKINGGVTSFYISENSRKIYLILNQKIVIYDVEEKKFKYSSDSSYRSINIKNNHLALKINNVSYEYSID